MAEKWLTIEHPQLPEAPPGRVTEESFLKVWKAKGWVEVEAQPSPKRVVEPETEAPKPRQRKRGAKPAGEAQPAEAAEETPPAEDTGTEEEQE